MGYLTNHCEECDRSFTRSDALAKHMRTVHETEALRPSDPVPKHQQAAGGGGGSGPGGAPGNKVPRIKLKLSQPKDEDQHPQPGEQRPASTSTSTALDDPTITLDDIDDIDLPEFAGQDTTDIGFEDRELALRPRELYRLLRRQIHWAEKEGQHLREEWEGIRPKRKQAWVEKEAVLDDLIHTELRLLSTVMGEGKSAEVPAAAEATSALEKLHHEQPPQHLSSSNL
jgi:hypothetical protein